MRTLLLTLTACAASVSSCSSDSAPSQAGRSSVGVARQSASVLIRNESTSTLTVQAFESAQAGGTRQPFGLAFTIAPGRTESRAIGSPGKVVALTIKASGQDIKYLSGEWVVEERDGGFRLYAFTDGAQTVRLYWNDKDGEEINMQ